MTNQRYNLTSLLFLYLSLNFFSRLFKDTLRFKYILVYINTCCWPVLLFLNLTLLSTQFFRVVDTVTRFINRLKFPILILTSVFRRLKSTKDNTWQIVAVVVALLIHISVPNFKFYAELKSKQNIILLLSKLYRKLLKP